MTGSARAVAFPRVVSIEDLRPLARRRLPKAVFDYLDGGAEGEVTLRENCRAFEDVTFRPRHAVALADCDLCTRVLGFDLSLPFLLAPVGYSRLMHPGGEVAAARAAGAAGHRLYSVDDLRTQAGRCESGLPRPRLLPALSDGWSRGGRGRHRQSAGSGILRAGRHHRYPRRRNARARFSQWHEGTRQRWPAGERFRLFQNC